ncbi:unnamed protein product [Cylicostephanus goldi]|uniref:Protein-tyrosine sulfotransferase n=1 Tax=Cylicostephanus goldi TaxID=71465 RepID=A0A3P7Q389_CYLGO|nr:unnamed protein product [Cylicostephanus goldi]
MRRILDFLEIPWNDSVLHHERFIGKDVSLSNVERSSDQVSKPDETVIKKTEEIHKNVHEWYKKAVSVVNDPARVDKPIVPE